jgi:hypothetical protein
MRWLTSGGGGYPFAMAEETTQTPPELGREALRGQSERTPAIALTGVFIVISVVVVVVAAVALLLYYVG